jgi:hypothetical protein
LWLLVVVRLEEILEAAVVLEDFAQELLFR